MVYAISILSVAIVLCSFYTTRIESTWLSLVVKTCSSANIRVDHPFIFIVRNNESRQILIFGQDEPLTYSNNKDYDVKADRDGDICTDSACSLVIYPQYAHNGFPLKLPYVSVTLHESFNSSYMFKYVTKFTTCKQNKYKILPNEVEILCSDVNFRPERKQKRGRPTCLPKKCPPSKYGRMCEHNCTRCQNGQCERNGECVVKVCARVSQTGIKCDTTCTRGYWGLKFETINNVSRQLEVCQHRCFCRVGAQCNGIDGTCPGGLCEAGYKIGCQEKCPPRMWSSDNVNCDNKCKCKHDEDCYHDGICPNGPKLDCPNVTHYGPKCKKKCHCINREICNNITGHCINGCDLQHYGKDCQYVCIAGRYHMKNEPADLCSGRCYCRNNQNCNATNGHCSNGCEVDYWGDACERECKYGPNCVYGKPCHCLGGNDECDNETGCIECSNRWMGQDCQTTCKDKFWGPEACSNPCHCAQPSDCRVADGECRGPCPLKRYGKRCDKDCNDDKTANILCSKKRCNCLDEDRDCNPITLKCLGGCDIRYTGGYGTKCDKICPHGQYIDRSGKCSGKCHCLKKSLCNVTGGACVGNGGCLVGWVEPTCLNQCIFGGQGCKKLCHCFKNSACHPITGTCPNGLCKLRYYGTDCQRKCPGDYFLETGSCKGICHCANPGQCRATDGECMDGVCSTGWEGDHCQTQCNYGLASAECREICHCKGGHPCERVTGYCPEGCDTRYHGPGCALECPTNHFMSSTTDRCTNVCHCVNPDKCNATNGVCISGGCKEGYKGSDCQTKCVKGRFGKNCVKYCHCPPDDCNIKTGMCSNSKCYPRYIGYNCQRTCPDATYLIKGICAGQCHCNNITKCHLLKGECLDGVCTPGWLSSTKPSGQSDRMCNIPCRNERWGLRCTELCHCRSGTPCNHTNGYCEMGCDTRWYYSPGCNKTCDGPNSEKYLDQFGKCTIDCECKEQKYCRVEHGVCEQGGCISGGQAGSTCLKPCTSGRYRIATDKNCTETCHCSGDLPCDDIGGFCLSGCHHRYRGLRCNDTCPRGYFGVKCSGICRCANITFCHVDDGKCSSGGCEDGYVGPSCQKPCSRNKYGHGCLVRCQCLNDAKCNHITGECPGGKCNKRHNGQNCDNKICPVHRYLINGYCDGECYCLNSRDCDAKTGSCGGSSCVAGRKGESCQYLCQMTFGYECKKQCHCLGNRQCDIITGYCPKGCDIRHTGDGCQTECPVGRYDPKTGCNKWCRCEKNEDCHIIDGFCRGGACQESGGLRFFGVDCQSRCNVGRYLINGACSGKCRCAVPEQCNVLNGSCNGGQCKPGWLGDKCNRECDDGNFGPKCSKKCRCKFKKPCEKDYGKCEDGCVTGWSGENCQWREDYSSLIQQISIYAGSIAGIGFTAVMFGYCAVALKRRRRQNDIKDVEQYLLIKATRYHSPSSVLPSRFEVSSPQISESPRRISRVSSSTETSYVESPRRISRVSSSTETSYAESPRRISRVSGSTETSYTDCLSSTTGRKILDGDSVQDTSDNLSDLYPEMPKDTQSKLEIKALSEMDLSNDLPTTSLGSMRGSRDIDRSISADDTDGQPRTGVTHASSRGSRSSLKSKTGVTPVSNRQSRSSVKSKNSLDQKASRKSKASQKRKDNWKSKTSQYNRFKASRKSRTSQQSRASKKSKERGASMRRHILVKTVKQK